jgi:hypothetical protein
MLLAFAITCFLSYFAWNTYFRKSPFDKDTQGALNKEGINTSNYQSVLDSTKNKLKDIQSQAAKQMEEVGN